MRALMRFGLKMDVDVDDLGVDPASVASNKIGVVDGVDIDPESERRELLASLLGQDVIDLLDQYAKLRGLALRDAMYQACSSALNAIAAEEGEGTRAPTRS